MKSRTVSLMLSLLLAPTTLVAQAIDPAGLYTNQFGTNNNGRELFQINALPDGLDRYSIKDIFGRGFNAHISPTGIITLDGEGSGSFSNADAAVFVAPDAEFPSYTLTRVVRTNPSMPLTLEQTVTPHPILAGQWSIVEEALDSVTGEDLSPDFLDTFTVQLADGNLRIIDSAGIYFQGPMDRADRALFRYFKENGVPIQAPLFEPFAGSLNNFPRHMIGTMDYINVNEFRVVLALQTPSVTRSQRQFLLDIKGERITPMAFGDVDGNGVVNQQDSDIMATLVGFDHFDGPYNIAADLDENDVIDARDGNLFSGQATPTYTIGPEISGSWYDPSHNGEGWNIIVLDETRVLVTWFSFQPEEGEQAWFLSVGNIEGNEIVFPDVNITQGGKFGPDFNPADVVRNHWGRMRMWFDGCDSGGITWTTPGEYQHGGLTLNRVSRLQDLPCSGPVAQPSPNSRMSGSWYDPSHDGEGWVVDVLTDTRAIVYWYTYDEAGNQFWMLGDGEIANNKITIVNLFYAQGAKFGTAFDSGDVELKDWGSFEFEMLDCNNATVRYESRLSEFVSVTLNPVRLAAYRGIGC